MVVSWFSYRHSKRLSDVSAHRSFSANRNSSKSTFLHVEKFKPNEREKKHTMQPSYTHIGKDWNDPEKCLLTCSPALALSLFLSVCFYLSIFLCIYLHSQSHSYSYSTLNFIVMLFCYCCFLLPCFTFRRSKMQLRLLKIKRKTDETSYTTNAHGLKRQHRA